MRGRPVDVILFINLSIIFVQRSTVEFIWSFIVFSNVGKCLNMATYFCDTYGNGFKSVRLYFLSFSACDTRKNKHEYVVLLVSL